MSVMDYFRTTNKGIYLMADLPATSNLSRSFFGMSLGLQIIFMLVFVGIFGMAIFRSVKKIKNPKFKTQKDEQDSAQGQNVEDQTNAKQTNDNLIYRFDEQDHQKQKKAEGDQQDKKAQQGQQQSEDEYDKQHDENEQKFLQIDSQVIFLQPFLIGHIVCNNIFATNIISIILILATVILFLLFNIKGLMSHIKWFSLLFMLPAIVSFVPVFINDHDMST